MLAGMPETLSEPAKKIFRKPCYSEHAEKRTVLVYQPLSVLGMEGI